MINKSRSLAKIVNCPENPEENGTIINAKDIHESEFSKYKNSECICLGCGAKMTLAHFPNQQKKFYFRAETQHADKNCRFNKGNRERGGYKRPDNVFTYVDKVIFPYWEFTGDDKEKDSGGHRTGPQESGKGGKKKETNFPPTMTPKTDYERKLETWYYHSLVFPLNLKLNDSYSFGELFITKRTVEEGTITDYTGFHIFAGTKCSYEKPKKALIASGKIDPKPQNYMIIRCEKADIGHAEDVYLYLEFASYKLCNNYWEKLKKLGSTVLEQKKNYTTMIVIFNDKFKDFYKDSSMRILYVKITKSNQFEIFKRYDDPE